MNIILIGMPGAGKSTIGVLLAKTLGMNFCDTDLIIQQNTGNRLQQIIDTQGLGAFLKAEEEAICSLTCRNTVIATGGSAVLSEKAMAHLQNHGTCVYLEIPLEECRRRIRNIRTRGIAVHKGQTLDDVFDERIPFYQKYAERTVCCAEKSTEDIVAELASSWGKA